MHDALQPTEIEFTERGPGLSHHLFRYPAKFHAPVARYLIDNFTEPGDLVFDPFCGSGTLLVEGALAGRVMFGVDIDPVATFISAVKSTPLQTRSIASLDRLVANLSNDWDPSLQLIPNIPNVDHWFEPHVLTEMGALRYAIHHADLTPAAREFALCIFLARVRAWSNADPVPVSGLEVTKHIRNLRKDGHHPDVRGEFFAAVRKGLLAIGEMTESRAPNWKKPLLFHSDAAQFAKEYSFKANAIITSPPYLSAVDYYRRHTLEMYWLEPSLTQAERQRLKPSYIGQYTTSKAMNDQVAHIELSHETKKFVERIGQSDPQRGRTALHYFQSMAGVLRSWSKHLLPNGRLVLVVGDGRAGKIEVPTAKLLAAEVGALALEVILRYPLRNRYMTYSRKNGADIAFENIIVLRR